MGTIDIRKPKLITVLTFFDGRSYFFDARLLLPISYSHSHGSIVNILQDMSKKPFSATLQVFQQDIVMFLGKNIYIPFLNINIYPNFKYFIILTRTFTSSVVMYRIS